MTKDFEKIMYLLDKGSRLIEASVALNKIPIMGQAISVALLENFIDELKEEFEKNEKKIP